LQTGTCIFLIRHARAMTISVRMLENTHMLLEANKWTLLFIRKNSKT